jgi:hypothetical protein
MQRINLSKGPPIEGLCEGQVDHLDNFQFTLRVEMLILVQCTLTGRPQTKRASD